MRKTLKKIFSLLYALVLVLSLTACKGDETNTDTVVKSDYVESTVWEEVEKVEKPTYTSGDIAREDFINTYRPYTDWRIYEIRTTKSDIKPTGDGTAYYVSNNGKAENDGLTPETPLPDYAAVRNKGIKTGDVIFFERGSIWRRQIEITVPGVTLAAYGDGKVPRIYTSPENSANKDCWLPTDVENVYVYKNVVYGDIGSIVFDDSECAFKSIYTEEDVSGSTSQRYVNSYKNLQRDLQMYHDVRNKKIYLYSDKGNPGERFNYIEMIGRESAISVKVDDVTIDGLCMKYCSFGIGASNSSSVIKGLTVRNCEFGWIGGNIQGEALRSTTRFGNAIEIWGGAVDYTVTNCYFWQVYDAGVTFQYDGDAVAPVQNVKFNNNVFDRCNYSVEFFLRTTTDSKITDFEIKGNLCWNAGEGLSSQRPDLTGCTHIRSGGAKLTNPIKIENNLFAFSVRRLLQTNQTNLGGEYKNNIYVQKKGKYVAANGTQKSFFTMDDNVVSNIQENLGDTEAIVVTILN